VPPAPGGRARAVIAFEPTPGSPEDLRGARPPELDARLGADVVVIGAIWLLPAPGKARCTYYAAGFAKKGSLSDHVCGPPSSSAYDLGYPAHGDRRFLGIRCFSAPLDNAFGPPGIDKSGSLGLPINSGGRSRSTAIDIMMLSGFPALLAQGAADPALSWR
jgi:hypothetical protein